MMTSGLLANRSMRFLRSAGSTEPGLYKPALLWWSFALMVAVLWDRKLLAWSCLAPIRQRL